MKVLIKLGGTLLDNPTSLAVIACQLAAVANEHQLVVVHGGGKQVTRYLDERGISSRFVGGLRVSDAAVVGAVSQVIAGSMNTQLVSATIAAGRLALGLSGVDGLLTRAEQLAPELEFVGRPIASDGPLLDLLLRAGYTPIVACLAGDGRGHIYNVNADAMAVSVAVGWGASRLLFLTDVSGVKGNDGDLLSTINSDQVKSLIDSGVAYGGMHAKLDAASLAVSQGINVTIASGSEPNIAIRLLQREAIGTTWAAPVGQGSQA